MARKASSVTKQEMIRMITDLRSALIKIREEGDWGYWELHHLVEDVLGTTALDDDLSTAPDLLSYAKAEELVRWLEPVDSPKDLPETAEENDHVLVGPDHVLWYWTNGAWRKGRPLWESR